MNIYFDTEFTGLVPNTTLISLGCVAETGEVFYGEFTDYDDDLVTPWIQENVIDNLLYSDEAFKERRYCEINEKAFGADINTNGGSFGRGTSEDVLRELKEWLKNVCPEGERIQFVSDVCHYDFFLLCNLFGGAFSLPENVCPWCRDICQDLIDPYDGDIKDGFDAFDYSREEACKFYNQGKLPTGKKHNALYDAMVIKMIYEGMR